MLTDNDKKTIIVLNVPDKYKGHIDGDELTYEQFMDDKIFAQLKASYIYFDGMVYPIDFLDELVNCLAISWNFHCILLKQFDKHMELLRTDIDFERKHHFELIMHLMRTCLEWTWCK